MTLVTIALGQGFPRRSPHLFLQARKLQRLLPHMVRWLWDAEDELRIKALMILRNVMGRLPREEASPIAVGLVQDLWPLFDGGCSRLRELSIRLFRVLLQSVLGGDRRRMRSKIWDLLLPLFFRMSDQSCSVAEVQTPFPPPRVSHIPEGGIIPKVPSPIPSCAGFLGSSPCCGDAPGMGRASAPIGHEADVEGCRVLAGAEQEEGSGIPGPEPAVPAGCSGLLARGSRQVHW
ncbi:uncharacterized protein LOC133262706 [Pezoporus flaviventris]|uniref:uncharacterized protein LOC133262706 n=1 Tax=Pezoporus flaviventris TaxID=889875 RepID=UPI002AB31A9F|nr:uncharacterized protein LOC133262706 [Pezoporus flaviventris]